MRENQLSYTIRGCIFTVYNHLGPGLMESAYEAALLYELRKKGFKCDVQAPLPLIYKNIHMDIGYRLDIVVEDLVIIEIKSVENLSALHHKQILTYLKLSGLKLGILVNFNTDNLSGSIFRKVNNL